MNIVDNSWIKLPRNFVNWSWYHDANMVQLYLYLLLKKLQNGRIIVLVDFNKFQPIGIDEAAPDWIKLYRKICDWGWYHEPNMVHLYVYFMLKAKLVINNDSRSEAWQLNRHFREEHQNLSSQITTNWRNLVFTRGGT